MIGFWKAFISFGVAVLVHGALAWGLMGLTANDRPAPTPISGFEVVELPSSAAAEQPQEVAPIVEDVQGAQDVQTEAITKTEKTPTVTPPLVPRPISVPKPIIKPISKPILKPVLKPEAEAKPKPEPLPIISYFKESNTMATQLAYIPPSQHATYLNNPKPTYPTQARKRGMEGRVILRVFVKADGGVKGVELHQSSGYELLDRSARVAVLRWRFEPATRGGRVVDGEVLIPFDFRLTSG